MKKAIVLLILICLMLSACSTVTGPITKKKYSSPDDLGYIQEVIENGRQQYVKQHPKLNHRMKRIILEGRFVKGMTNDEVRASWGNPDMVYRTKTNEIINEQWVYKNIDPKTLNRVNYFLNFKAGRLSTWQEQ